MPIFNFLRFRKRVPDKGSPPKNFVDVAYDVESGKLKAIDSDGNPVLFDGAGGGDIVSADISDATYDPESAEAFGKAVLYSGGGSLTTTELRVVSGANQWDISALGITANRTYFAPDIGGTLASLRAYPDATAANAVVSVGDAWWDTTLKKVRVRLV